MAIPWGKWSFAAGEVSPSLWGHVDYSKFAIGLSTSRNGFISYRGGYYSRAGTAFVGFSKQTGRTVPPRMVTFQFSINQGLSLEFGNFYMRVVSNGEHVIETPIAVSAATNADPGQLTAPGSGFANGDWVFASGFGGMTQINGQTLVVGAVAGDTFALFDVYGDPVDSTAWGVYTGGGTVARIYTLVTPWAEADLGFLKFTQSADVMSLCCWNQQTGTSYPPYDLSRLADDNWTLAVFSTAARINPPTSGSGAASSAGTTDYQYVVTSVSASGEESIASPIIDIPDAVNIASTLGSTTFGWNPEALAVFYNLYKAPPAFQSTVPTGSLFGYIAMSYGGLYVDGNVTPNFTQVPPLHLDPFQPGQILSVTITSRGSGLTGVTAAITTATGSGADGFPVINGGELVAYVFTNKGQDYAPGDTIIFTPTGPGVAPTGDLVIGPQTGTWPSVPAYFQQRRAYAGTPNQPDTYWLSQPGLFHNFDSRVPTIDSDAITGTPWSVQVDGIQFMVPMPGGLVVLTGLSAWQLTGAGGSSLNPQPITPSSQQAQPQAYNGINSKIPPIKTEEDIIYVQAKGSILRDLTYNFYANIYTGTDITFLSSQLFTGYTMREMAWCEEPYKLFWVTRNDGALLSLTYMKAQEVMAWARHDTNGLFWSVCSVTEPPVDALYVATQRFPGGRNAYMIERMNNRLWNSVEQCWCVDAALTLPQPTPNATLTADSATGLGALVGVTDLIGGQDYSAGTTATVSDPTGSGAVVGLVIAGGVITGINFPSPGMGYTDPRIILADPAGTGNGASALAVLDNTTTFTANAAVFGGGDVGNVIRMGGGIVAITQYIDPQTVLGNITSPIIVTIPNSGGQVQPAVAGEWSMTEPASVIGGLWHLIGATVTGLADGLYITPRVVAADGTVTLDQDATAVTIGLAFQVQMQSLNVEAGQPTMQGRRKKVAAVTARVENSAGFKIGANQPNGSALSPQQVAPVWIGLADAPNKGVPPYGSVVKPLYTGDVRIPITGGFDKPGQVALQQDLPYPLQVLALIPEILVGDTPENELSQQRKAA